MKFFTLPSYSSVGWSPDLCNLCNFVVPSFGWFCGLVWFVIWKGKCPIFKAIVAGFSGEVALKNRTLGVPGMYVLIKGSDRL